ncbi:MAG: ABC transporter ATP-binding protein [Clostridiales bacterium]|jgi:putative ABC transport system ATP-binding protein|nr:ABC transporter ATP-binding protein [Clostridiales bacterium]
MAIITTENVCRVFSAGREKVHALKNINIEIEAGALTMLRGRSGSGKTTLMNSLGALDYPTSGNIYLDGTDITKLSPGKRDRLRTHEIGFVFQSIALISSMSAYENVDFGMRICGISAAERKKRVLECLTLVGLGKRINHRPHELSGGEQQRVAIARAIAHTPKVIFADEPTAELDTQMALRVVGMFKDLVHEHGLTIVMTTHDPNMMELADHVYTLEDGEIIGRE